MRIHTSLTAGDLRAILKACRASEIFGAVHFSTLDEHGSKTHARAFEVKLGALLKVDGDGRRWGNSGGYGATSQTSGEYAATYDEWGWFLAGIFAFDPSARAGHNYADRADFNDRTGLAYDPEGLEWYLREHGEDPYPFTSGRNSGTAGRKLAGRIDGDTVGRRAWSDAFEHPGDLIDGWLRYAPRTLGDAATVADAAPKFDMIEVAR